MASIAVRCKACGTQVPTGIATGPVARPLLGTHTLRCRACGAAAQYHGADFIIPARATG